MLAELPKPQTSVSVVRLLVCASLVEPIEVATADLVELGSADQAHGSPHALFERAEGATACREHDLGGHVGGRVQAGCGTGRPYGTRGASPGPGRAAGSDRARLDDAGLGDHLMMGKELEKPRPVGAKIPFLHARTVAPLLAPSTRRDGYPGWLNHPASTFVDDGPGQGNRALKRDACATATKS